MPQGTRAPNPPDPRDSIKCLCQPWTRHSRNLVVCIDGTSNQFSEKNTNVVEIHHQIIKETVYPQGTNATGNNANEDGQDNVSNGGTRPPVQQITYYSSGIGTYVSQSYFSFASWAQWFDNTVDLAIAWNFSRIVQKAYRWIVDHYQPGDRIFLFGFSRGAYQVRTIAAMIEKVGLLFSGNTELIPFAYELYKKSNDKLSAPFRETFSRKHVRVHFLGAWDTVSSIGILRGSPLPLTDSSDYICFFRHALALDERRVKFIAEYVHPNSSESSSKSEAPEGSLPVPVRSLEAVKEVWFAGSHSDIGGGNKENLTLDLEGVPLAWMEHEASLAGLELLPRKWDKTDWNWEKLRDDKLFKSLTWAWWPLEFVPFIFRPLISNKAASGQQRPWALHRGRGREIVSGQRIHASLAFQNPEYRPKASFTFQGLDWSQIVGKGATENLSWASGLEDFLEMDVFDMTSALKLVAEDMERGVNVQENLNHLNFIALSAQGVAAIGRIKILDKLLAYLRSDLASLRSSSANCLAQLVTFNTFFLSSSPEISSLRSLKDRMVSAGIINQIAETLKSHDSKTFARGAWRLRQFVYDENSASKVEETGAALDLIAMLGSPEPQSRETSLGCLRYLYQHEQRSLHDYIVRAGIIERIAEMLKSQDDETFAEGIKILSELAYNANIRTISKVAETGVVATLIAAMPLPEYSRRGTSTQCLMHLFHHNKKDMRDIIIRAGIIEQLAEMLKNQDSHVFETASVYMHWFIYDDNSASKVIETDAVTTLITMLRAPESERRSQSAECLERLFNCDQKILKNHVLRAGVIKQLVDMIKSEDNIDFATGAENIFRFVNDEDSAAILLESGIVMNLIATLKTPESTRRDKSLYCLWFLFQIKQHGFRDLIIESGTIELLAKMLKSQDDDIFATGASRLRDFVTNEKSVARVVETDALMDLVATLKAPDRYRRQQSIECLRYLFRSNLESLQEHIVRAGIIEQLAGLLKSPDTDTFNTGTAYLYDFVYDQFSGSRFIATDAAVDLIAVLKTTDSARRKMSMECLTRLFQNNLEILRAHIVNAGIVKQLADMLKSQDDQVYELGVRHFHEFVYDEHSASQVIETETVTNLIAILWVSDYWRQRTSMECLENVFKLDLKILQLHFIKSGIIEQLVKMLKSQDSTTFQRGCDSLPKFIYDEYSSCEVTKSSAVADLIVAVKSLRYGFLYSGINCLKNLAQHDQKILRDQIVKAGIIELLADMLMSEDSYTFEAGIDYLHEFVYDDNSASRVVETDAVKTLLVLVQTSDPTSELRRRDQSIQCMKNLIRRNQPILREHIVEAGVIKLCAEMLKDQALEVFKKGTQCLHEFIYDEYYASKSLEAGVITDLIALLVGSDSARRAGASECLGNLTRYDSIRHVVLTSSSRVVFLLAEMMQDGENELCSHAGDALAKLVAYDDAQEQLSALDIVRFTTLLQHTDPCVRFSPGSFRLWSVIATHAYIRQTMLKENFMEKLLRQIQNDTSLGVREWCSLMFRDLLQYDELRADALQIDSVSILTRLLEDLGADVYLRSLGSPWEDITGRLSYRASVVDVAANALREFGQHDDAIDAIVNAGSIEAATARLFPDGEREVWDLMHSGATFIAGCAKHARGREVILKAKTIDVIGAIYGSSGEFNISRIQDGSIYETVQGAFKKALEELAKHDDTRTAAEIELAKVPAR